MPKAPYTPNVDVALSGQEIPEFRPTVRPEAFGVNVGQAIEKLGSTFEQAGNQVFNTAVQLQEEHLRTKAMNASTQYYAQTAKTRQDFLAAENPGPEGLQKYIKDIGDARDKIRGTIAEPYAQRLYDNETRVDLERAYTAGAVHAATGTRRATMQAMQAQEEVYKGRIAEDPANMEGFKENLRNLLDSIDRRLGPYGQQAKPETIAATKEKAEEEARAGQIKSLMHSDVPRAVELANSPSYKGHLGIYTDETLKQLQQEDRQVGTRVEADKIMTDVMEKHKAGAEYMSMEDAVNKMKDVAEKTHPNDPLWGQLGEVAIRTKYRAFNSEVTNAYRKNIATIDKIIDDNPGWTSVEQVRGVPEGDAALKALGSKLGPIELQQKLDRIIGMKNQHDNSVANTFIAGMRNEDPERFLDYDFSTIKQTPENLKRWNAERERYREKQGTDPRVITAVNWLRPSGVLHDLGFDKVTENNKDEYTNFVGLVDEALLDWRQAHGNRNPTQREFLNDIKPDLMRQVHDTQHNWMSRALGIKDWDKEFPIWKTEPTPQFKMDMNAQAAARGEDEPTDREILNLWFLNQYQTLRKKK